MTKFFSLDIETTGLKPSTCQILEIAVVFYDTEILMPVNERPFIRRAITDTEIRGEPYGLAMNAELLREIASRSEKLQLLYEAVADLSSFVISCVKDERVIWLGKNVAGFDLKFLNHHTDFDLYIPSHHRTFDLGSFFFDPKIDTECLPSLRQCMERVGIEGEVPHTALEDARMVVECVDRKLRV